MEESTTLGLEQMAEWEAWLQSTKCTEVMQANSCVEGLHIEQKTMFQVEDYAGQMEQFSRGIFHLDDVSQHPLLLHRYKLMLPAFQKGLGLDSIKDDQKTPVAIDLTNESPIRLEKGVGAGVHHSSFLDYNKL